MFQAAITLLFLIFFDEKKMKEVNEETSE